MKGKTFMNSKGDIVKVDHIDGNSVILNGGERVSLNKMLDTNNFTEINESTSYSLDDPFSLMNRPRNDIYNNIANQLNNAIRNTNPSSFSDTNDLSSIKVIDSVVERHHQSNDNAILVDNSDEEMKRLKDKMIKDQLLINEKVNKNNEIFSKLTGEESVILPTYNNDRDDIVVDMYNNDNIKVEQKIIDNPVNVMFKSLKRSTPIDIDITISEMLPKKEFIQMWEESYDVSIIEYLADEFLGKYSRNPLLLRGIIIDKIREYAYSTDSKISDVVKVTKPIAKRTNNKKSATK